MRISSPSDEGAIRELLLKVFQAQPTDSFLSPAMMDWKYWRAHPFRHGSRSYVIEGKRGLIAHGCLWPVRLVGKNDRFDGMHLIDWAATRESMGAGLRVMKAVLREVDFCLAIGGSEDTRKILPMFDFHPMNSVWMYARPLRPLLQLRRRTRIDVRALAKVGRNAVWLLRGETYIQRGWTAAVCEPDKIPSQLWQTTSAADVTALRSPELYQYLTRCPDASFVTYLIQFDNEPVGYFCLANNLGQIRFVDYHLAHPSPDSWDALIRLGVREAGRIADAAELVAQVTEPEAAAALERAGFRRTEETPILIHWKHDAPRPRSVRLTAIDNDAAYLHGSAPEFIT